MDMIAGRVEETISVKKKFKKFEGVSRKTRLIAIL